MRQPLLFLPHLRSGALPRWLRRELIDRPSIRLKATLRPPRTSKESLSTQKQPPTISLAQRSSLPTTPRAKLRRGRSCQLIRIYHSLALILTEYSAARPDLNISWRNRKDDIFGRAAHHNNICLWCFVLGGSTGLFRR
jgi:hypothetical protein